MKLRFTTSVGSVRGGSFIEGRVIEVETLSPELQEWLRAGVVVALKDAEPSQTTVAPDSSETTDIPPAAPAARTRPARRSTSTE